MSDSSHVTPFSSWVDGDLDFRDFLTPEIMKSYEDSSTIVDDQEQMPLPDNNNLGFKADGGNTNFMIQENDEFAENHAFPQVDTSTPTYQVYGETTFTGLTENDMAQYDDATSETYDLITRFSETAAIDCGMNEYPGYAPASALPWSQQQQQPEYAPESKAPESNAPESNAPESNAPESKAPESNAPESNAPESNAPETGPSLEQMLWTSLSSNDQQATIEAGEGHADGSGSLASHSLNTDWSDAHQSYMEHLPHQPALLHQHQALQQPPQQPAPQQLDETTGQKSNKRKRQTDKPASSTRAPKKNKVLVERTVMTEDGKVEVVASECTPDYAAALANNPQEPIKKVKNPKRLGLAPGLKAARYNKRCQECRLRKTDCLCPGGFVD